jgi:hypothetical protein
MIKPIVRKYGKTCFDPLQMQPSKRKFFWRHGSTAQKSGMREDLPFKTRSIRKRRIMLLHPNTWSALAHPGKWSGHGS